MSVFAFQCLNFAILATVLFFFLRKKLGAAFKVQREELESRIRDSSVEYETTKADLENIRSLVSGLSQKSSEMKAAFKREIEHETKHAEIEADRMTQKMISDSDAQMKNDIQKAIRELQRETFQRAMVAAKTNLEKQFKTNDQAWISQMIQNDPEVSRGKKNYAS